MRRIHLIIISVIVVLGLGTGTYAYVAQDRGLWPFMSSQSAVVTLSGNFADLLSDQTAIYFHLDLANPEVNKIATDNPKLKANLDLIKQGWNRLTAEMQADLSKENPDVGMFINNLLVHKLHFAFAGNPNLKNDLSMAELEKTVDLSAFGDMAVGIEVANKDEAVSMMNKIKDLLQKAAEKDDAMKHEISEVMIKSQAVTKISEKSSDTATPKTEMGMANIGDRMVIITSSLPVMEGMISRSQDKSLPSFTNKTSFSVLLSKINEPAWALVYADNEKQMKMQQAMSGMADMSDDPNSQAMMEMQNAMMNNPLFKSQSIAAINLTDKGLHLISYFKPTAPGTISGFKNTNQSLAATIPDGALLYTENNDVVSQLAPVIEMMAFSVNASVNAALGQDSDIFKEWEKSTGLSIKDDIAPLFSGDTAFAIHQLNNPLFPVSLTFLSSLNDATKAKAAMEKITQVIVKQINETVFSDLPPPPLKKEDVSGVSVTSYGEMMPTEAMYNYAFMNSDKLLAITSSTTAIKNVISALGKTVPTLDKSSKYPELLKKQTSFSNVSFIDVKSIMDIVLPFATEMMPEEQKAEFDRDVKPYLNLINNIAGYSTVMNDVVKSEGIIQMVD